MKRIIAMVFITIIFSTLFLTACNMNLPDDTTEDTDASDTNTALSETDTEEENDYEEQIFDYYRTYDEARLDIENGFVFNMDYSLTEAAMPTVFNNNKVSFFVHHENVLEINIILKNLLDGTGRDSVTADSIVKFEVYDPSGKTAYSFISVGKEIETLTEITDEIELYPGEWTYQINFAYTSNGFDETRIVIAAKYETIHEEDIQWLLENKLNTLQ